MSTELDAFEELKQGLRDAIRDYETYTPDERAGVTEASEVRRLVRSLRELLDASESNSEGDHG